MTIEVRKSSNIDWKITHSHKDGLEESVTLDSEEVRELVEELGRLVMNNVCLKPWQNLEIWCDEHMMYHRMSYEYLLSLVPTKSHSERGF